MVAVAKKVEQQVEAKVLEIYCKVSDRFTATLAAADGSPIFEQDDGYVPEFMPGDHYGDYIILNIDLETGQILNWVKPRADQIEAWINPED